MPRKILIIGLSGSGKTTLAATLAGVIVDSEWLNADRVRSHANDWDFSLNGRLRQAERLKSLADDSKAKFVIIDFIAPLEKQRIIVSADVTIWMDTVSGSKYQDTDKIFVEPCKYNFRFTKFDEIDVNKIRNMCNVWI